MTAKPVKKKKRPGPEPKLHSLYPLTFQAGIDILVGKKPKKKLACEKGNELPAEEVKKKTSDTDSESSPENHH
jgi:hypothetical protein